MNPSSAVHEIEEVAPTTDSLPGMVSTPHVRPVDELHVTYLTSYSSGTANSH